MDSLVFEKDDAGDFNGSAYDLFLRKNGLPLHPEAGEDPQAYASRLRAGIEALSAPRWVSDADGKLALHTHAFQFGADELAGLRAFLDENRGHCASCHTPPAFSDFLFHATGVSQDEYEAVHGSGAFAQLAVPPLANRAMVDPAFLSIPDAAKPGHADLGLWGVFANPALPDPQPTLKTTLCAQLQLADAACSDAAALDGALVRFKTPGLRDLGHSAPYMHNGAFDTLEDAVARYLPAAEAARAGRLRNGDPAMAAIHLAEADVAPLAAFLRSLDEDYR
jgi:cytochrome c peroxidase